MFTPSVIDASKIKDGAILIIDVDYRTDHAIASGVLIQEWDCDECAVINVRCNDIQAYEPGAFYKRELPCIHDLLDLVTVKLKCIVIDGYVVLGENEKPGLGAYLRQSLADHTPIIGVAKTFFRGTPDSARLCRNGSTAPLFVTSAGIDQDEARKNIAAMHGAYRLPSMLKFVDQCCRTYKETE